jgi:hypothetical protein
MCSANRLNMNKVRSSDTLAGAGSISWIGACMIDGDWAVRYRVPEFSVRHLAKLGFSEPLGVCNRFSVNRGYPPSQH